MPVQTGKDQKGCYARWGNSGAKYYYACGNKRAMGMAKNKAYKQGIAIGEEASEQWANENPSQDLDSYWKELIESGEAEKYEAVTSKPQDKPGGSNVGQYKGVKKFCGPAGGAPAGSFPVNTRSRAVAALSYARNAPNPAGIRKCVCRNWPTLPACKKKKESVRDIDIDNFVDECRRK